MSVAKWGADDGNCGATNSDILHPAICRLVASGVTVVAAAANDSGTPPRRVPAAYNEVITVSALADTDGKPGGLGGNRCWSWGGYDVDDTFADFSNYGPDVDLIAPGQVHLVHQARQHLRLVVRDVDGGAPRDRRGRALQGHPPLATPAEVKRALQYLGSTNWSTGTDPDGIHERLLDVSRIGPLRHRLDVSPSPAVVNVTGAGGTVPVTLALSRATVLEELTLSVSGTSGRHDRQPRHDSAVRIRGHQRDPGPDRPEDLSGRDIHAHRRRELARDDGDHDSPGHRLRSARHPRSGADRYATAAAISAGCGPACPSSTSRPGSTSPTPSPGPPRPAPSARPLLLVTGTPCPPPTADRAGPPQARPDRHPRRHRCRLRRGRRQP